MIVQLYGIFLAKAKANDHFKGKKILQKLSASRDRSVKSTETRKG